MALLDAEVRRVDEDRWLASRFAPREAREALVALYAFNYEVARTAEVVSEPGLGDIRLAWWRELIEELEQGHAPRAHPAAEALVGPIRSGALDGGALRALIEARRGDLDGAAPASAEALEFYVDATAGAVMTLALRACAAEAPAGCVRDAGRAWGFAGLARRAAAGASVQVGGADLEGLARASLARLREAGRCPAAAFPALGYVCLVGPYLDAVCRSRAAPGLFSRQLRLVAAAATGRL